MSNPFGNDLPPGVRVSDIGSDDYFCDRCQRQIAEEDIDEDLSQAFVHICKNCAEEIRAEDEEEP